MTAKQSVATGARRGLRGIGPADDMGMVGRLGDRQLAADRLDPMDRAMIVD